MPILKKNEPKIAFAPHGAIITLNKVTIAHWFHKLKPLGVYVQVGDNVINYSPFHKDVVQDYITCYGLNVANDWADRFNVKPKRAVRLYSANVNAFILSIDKSDSCGDDLRALPHRQWLPSDKSWYLTINHRNIPALVKFFDKYECEFDDAAKKALAQIRVIADQIPDTLRVKVDGLTLTIDLPYDANWSYRLNYLAAHHKVNANRYSAPVSPANVNLLQRLADDLKITLPEKELADALKVYHANIEFSAYTTSTFNPPVAKELRPFQKAGVEYAVRAKRCIIGDQQGLGKTPQGIAWLAAIEQFPAVIVAPASLLNVWRDHLRDWLPNRTVSKVKGNKPSASDYQTDIVLVGYPTLSARVESILETLKPKAVVWDEAHYIRTAKKKQGVYSTKRVQASKDLAQNIDYRLMLTGTPMSISPMDFCTLLDILGYLDTDFGGYYQFANEFAGSHMGSFGMTKGDVSVEALHRLNELMRSRCYVRREKHQVLDSLPEKQRTELVFPLSNRGEYEQAKADVIKYCVSMVEQDKAFAQAIAPYDDATKKRMIQERQQDVGFKAAKAQQLVKINTLKKLAVLGKMDSVYEWIDTFLETTTDNLVIFAHHKDIQQAVYKRYADVSSRMFAGDKPDQQTAETYAFMNDPERRLMVASDIVGREGHTWTRATHVLFIELGWTSTAHEQCEDRTHRYGQKNAVNIYYSLGEESIEMDIYELLKIREIAVKAATNGDMVEASNDSIMKGLLQRLGVYTAS